jgi:hypothetical protein
VPESVQGMHHRNVVYRHELPSLFGFPFFYWYQFAWVPLTALIIWIVYQDGLKKGDE